MNHYPEITPEELEQIEQYLAGSLSPDQQAAFEQRLLADAGWHQKVQQVRLLSIGIQETKVETMLHEIHHEAISRPPAKTVRLFSWKKIAAAAVLIIAAGGGIWWLGFRQQSHQQLFAAYFKPDAGLPTTMSTPLNYTFEKAMVDYKTGNYRNAIKSWKELQVEHPDSDTLNYFIGVALLADHDYPSANDYLDKVINSGKKEFLNDAYWYKGLSLLYQGHKSEAVAHIRLSGHTRAAELIKKIE